jgi:membrane-bound serine protease (ClpP class)
MRRLIFWLLAVVLLGPSSALADEPEKAAPVIMTVTVADPIGPGVAEFLEDAIEKASRERAACLIILLDTPGGVVETMRKMVQAIYASDVPVVVYVSPSGARAASAGVMITMAADIAAMAPGTNIGAAHPVGAGGKELEDASATKALNDLVAFTKGVAQRRGRNAEWAEKAVRESVSITADEALKNNVIDLVAKDLDDLIAQIKGRKVQGKGKLDLENARIEEIVPNLRTKILKLISDPNIAYILFMIGLAGLYFELSNPGAIFPGVIGAIALILAFFSFQTLPVNIAGILLILLSVVFFILEIKVTSFGMLSVAGVVSMVLGSLMLFKGAGPEFQVAWRVMIPTVVLISGFFVGVVTLVVRAYVHRPFTGSEGLVGEIGVVKQARGPEGKVLVHGELWQASFSEPCAENAKVVVERVDGLVVVVKPLNR